MYPQEGRGVVGVQNDRRSAPWSIVKPPTVSLDA